MFGYYCKVVVLTKLFVLVQFPSTSRNIITLKKVLLLLKLTKAIISMLSKLVFYLKCIFCVSPSAKQCIFSIYIIFFEMKNLCIDLMALLFEKDHYIYACKSGFQFEFFFCIFPSAKVCIVSISINFI